MSSGFMQAVRLISRLAQLDDWRSAPAPTDGQVATYRTEDAKWGPEDAPSGLPAIDPEGTNEGQVATVVEGVAAWTAAPEELPAEGSEGDVLTVVDGAWTSAAPAGGGGGGQTTLTVTDDGNGTFALDLSGAVEGGLYWADMPYTTSGTLSLGAPSARGMSLTLYGQAGAEQTVAFTSWVDVADLNPVDNASPGLVQSQDGWIEFQATSIRGVLRLLSQYDNNLETYVWHVSEFTGYACVNTD